MIVVSQTKNDIQVMNEKTYKIQTIKKPKQMVFPSKKINMISIDYQLFIPPIKNS